MPQINFKKLKVTLDMSVKDEIHLKYEKEKYLFTC